MCNTIGPLCSQHSLSPLPRIVAVHTKMARSKYEPPPPRRPSQTSGDRQPKRHASASPSRPARAHGVKRAKGMTLRAPSSKVARCSTARGSQVSQAVASSSASAAAAEEEEEECNVSARRRRHGRRHIILSDEDNEECEEGEGGTFDESGASSDSHSEASHDGQDSSGEAERAVRGCTWLCATSKAVSTLARCVVASPADIVRPVRFASVVMCAGQLRADASTSGGGETAEGSRGVTGSGCGRHRGRGGRYPDTTTGPSECPAGTYQTRIRHWGCDQCGAGIGGACCSAAALLTEPFFLLLLWRRSNLLFDLFLQQWLARRMHASGLHTRRLRCLSTVRHCRPCAPPSNNTRHSHWTPGWVHNATPGNVSFALCSGKASLSRFACVRV